MRYGGVARYRAEVWDLRASLVRLRAGCHGGNLYGLRVIAVPAAVERTTYICPRREGSQGHEEHMLCLADLDHTKSSDRADIFRTPSSVVVPLLQPTPRGWPCSTDWAHLGPPSLSDRQMPRSWRPDPSAR